MKQIPVWFNKKIVAYALVDDKHFALVNRYTWNACIDRPIASVGRTRVYMHILIFGKPAEGLLWGHKNNNPLDNRACNLQQITHSQNAIAREEARRVRREVARG